MYSKYWCRSDAPSAGLCSGAIRGQWRRWSAPRDLQEQLNRLLWYFDHSVVNVL
jgi:hypothetical protein